MCYRTKLNKKIFSLEKSLDARFLEPDKYQPQLEINAFSFSETPVITYDSPGEIQMFQWGLIPFWAKDDTIKKMTLNSKIETAAKKPAFRNSVDNRCLVIAEAYYEWQWLDPKGKTKQKFILEPRDQEIFAFAGIFSTWKNPENNNIINSYSILTTEASDLMSKVHNNKKRMPVVLKPQDHKNWLQGSDLRNFALPYDVPLTATAID